MPSVVPGFEYDIFISYRHNDNRGGASIGSGQGWVTEFVTALQEEVAATIKAPVTIYFDKNPHDGLQQHHEVDDSLREKLKCLVFIPIVSQTYCDPKAFAWAHELVPFIHQATSDSLGLKTKVTGGNIASRVLPVKIHDIDSRDKALFEETTGSVLRSIDFIYKESGVNRPLLPSDDRQQNEQRTDYRNQVNKVANAIKEIISGLHPEANAFTPGESIKAAAEPIHNAARPKRKWRLNTRVTQTLLRFNLPFIGALIALTVLGFVHFSETKLSPTYKTAILPPDNTRFGNFFGSHFTLSPNGTMLAFASFDSTEKSQLYVRPLNATEAHALKGTEGARHPFWSPDSRFIGFFADGKLKKIDASGGSALTLCDAIATRGGSWNKDGVIIYSNGNNDAISSISANGGTSTRVTQLDTARHESTHRWPVFFPDGQHFFFTARVNTTSTHPDDAIFVGSLDSSFTPRMIVKASSSLAFANGYLLYYKEGTLLAQMYNTDKHQVSGDPIPIANQVYFESLSSNAAFSVSQNGLLAYQVVLSSNEKTNFIWFNRNGTRQGGFGKASLYGDIRISREGTRVAIKEYNRKAGRDLWLYEINRDAWTRFTFISNRTNSISGEVFSPVWSPDSKMIAYGSSIKDNLGGGDIHIRAASGAGTEEAILETPDFQTPSDWSRDGKFIAYTSASVNSNGSDIWMLPMSTSGGKAAGQPFPFLQTDFSERNAFFSPDGHWVAYQSNESGRNEIYLRPFPGPGGKWQVSTKGGVEPRWRGDGKELFFVSPDFNGMMSAEIKASDATVVVGAERPLFQFETRTRGSYDVTSDGQKFLVATPQANITSIPVTLVVNWLGELKEE